MGIAVHAPQGEQFMEWLVNNRLADTRGVRRAVLCSGGFFHSIKGKIFILFAVTFLSIGVLAGAELLEPVDCKQQAASG